MANGNNAGKTFANRKRPAKGAMQPHDWSEDEIKRMDDLIGAGLSIEKVAKQLTRDFKRKFSKNSVTCKNYRLKGN